MESISLTLSGRHSEHSTPVEFDESISHYEVHAHQLYKALNNNHCDEICA